MTDLATIPTPKLGFGNVIKGTFGVIRRNFVTFLTLIVGLFVLPLVPVIIGVMEMVAKHYVSGGVLLAVGVLAIMVASCVLQAGLIHATVADLNGRKANAGDCISTGLKNFLPMMGIITLAILAVVGSFAVLLIPLALLGKSGPGPMIFLFVIGLIALYVAWIMVGLAWSLIFPAQVVEHTGVLGAFTRSGKLTKHNRWRIFGLLILWTIVSSVVQGVLSNLVGAGWTGPTVAPGASPMAALSAFTRAYWVIVGLMSIVSSMVGSAGIANIYYELRRVKEGVGPEALASVFD